MTNYKKTSPKSKKGSILPAIVKEDEYTIDTLLKICKPQISSKTLLKSCGVLEEEREHLHDTQKAISEQPLLAAFILWAKEVALENADMMNAAKLLLEADFIRITAKSGKIWTIENTSTLNHRAVIDAIRCTSTWPIPLREEVVTNYISFINWLSDETHGTIQKIEDPDQLLVKGRLFPYSQFIKLIAALRDKEQLAAKLLYFGGKRILDDVINLELDAIDFGKKAIRYKSQLIHYPPHVFADIQMLVGKRTSGRLFLGRQNAPLSRLTIFRKFKEVAYEVGLGPSFLPTILTSSN